MPTILILIPIPIVSPIQGASEITTGSTSTEAFSRPTPVTAPDNASASRGITDSSSTSTLLVSAVTATAAAQMFSGTMEITTGNTSTEASPRPEPLTAPGLASASSGINARSLTSTHPGSAVTDTAAAQMFSGTMEITTGNTSTEASPRPAPLTAPGLASASSGINATSLTSTHPGAAVTATAAAQMFSGTMEITTGNTSTEASPRPEPLTAPGLASASSGINATSLTSTHPGAAVTATAAAQMFSGTMEITTGNTSTEASPRPAPLTVTGLASASSGINATSLTSTHPGSTVTATAAAQMFSGTMEITTGNTSTEASPRPAPLTAPDNASATRLDPGEVLPVYRVDLQLLQDGIQSALDTSYLTHLSTKPVATSL
ncbi:unnamed protein product [Schistocephalus solidus]|uniref:SEA domain-containing protein n=1 Tax=Schistocephalus solidus TaxID=70667 RepID=A0A183TLA4_SCHSO|nr:unnamed protein product [Schistocephalus solidus]